MHERYIQERRCLSGPDLYKFSLIKRAIEPVIFNEFIGDWIQWNERWKFLNIVLFALSMVSLNKPVIPRSEASFVYNEASSWPIWTSFFVFYRVELEHFFMNSDIFETGI